jgi:integrase
MSDARSKRKARVVPFISMLDKDRRANLSAVIDKAKQLELEGFESIQWKETTWKINAGRFIKQAGKNCSSASLIFHYPEKISNAPLNGDWADLIKALVLFRFHRKNQSVANQRVFITSISYVAHEALKLGQQLTQLTPENLDSACRLIALHYSKGAAYNMHKAIGEFAAHCDVNGLCKIFLNYKFSGMKRPDSTSGVGYKRLDDPETLNTKSDKIITAEVFRILGKLYQNVPKNHKYRFYILILTLLACLGRRFSEISLLPNQNISRDDEGRTFIEYFPRKTSQGDTFTPKRRLYLPTETIDIVTDVLAEIAECCSAPRDTAAEMQRVNGADLTFLSNISDNQILDKKDLKLLGLTPTILDTTGWLRINGHTFPNKDKTYSWGVSHYTNKTGVIKYCQKYFSPKLIAPIHIDQNGKKYYLHDLLLVRHMGLSSGAYSHWIAVQCTHSMMTTFLRYLKSLATTYAATQFDASFTSHHFRHTLNTLLDEGGLSDLLQTEWFGRTNPRDTKAYQHTSREKRALMLREDIKKGQVYPNHGTRCLS